MRQTLLKQGDTMYSPLCRESHVTKQNDHVDDQYLRHTCQSRSSCLIRPSLVQNAAVNTEVEPPPAAVL